MVPHLVNHTVCVGSRGPWNSKIMLIGEAPGEKEDKEGKPFVGRAGRLLEDVLIEVGLQNRVFITNVVKCRPPSNRTPTPTEMTACAELYLYEEIAEVEPAVIVLLGIVAQSEFLPTLNRRSRFVHRRLINQASGLDISVILVPTVHPSHAKRQESIGNPEPRKQLKEDLELAKGFVY